MKAEGRETGVMRREVFLGCPVDLYTMQETLNIAENAMRQRSPTRHVVINVAKLVNMRHDALLREDICGSDVISVDGMGVVWGARLLGLPVPERVAGIDLMERILGLCCSNGFRPYFLGAHRSVLRQAIDNLARRYPSLEIAGFRNGYFTAAEEDEVVSAIRRARPDCLFVGISSPMKERFTCRYARQTGVPFVMGVGGSIDVLAGRVQRAPNWMQKAGFEWAYRLAQEPRRMWWRYFNTNTIFLGLMGRELARRAFRADRSTERAAR
jgi:N-acetylglucosaminyldiphosphoundecaprenol N-acetyl-beta-D-mannosaminyltransferase